MSSCIVISSTKEAVKSANKQDHKSVKVNIDRTISRMILTNQKIKK